MAPRQDGRWHLRWRVGGKEKTTTALSKPAALKRAREIAKSLSGSTGSRSVSHGDGNLIDRLKALAASSKPAGIDASALLGQIEGTIARVGSWSEVERAVQHWEASGIGRIERVPMIVAVERFIGIYESDRARHTLAGVRKEVEAFVGDPGRATLGVWEVRRELLEEWIGRADRGTAPGARFFNNRLGTWRTFFNRCKDWGYWPKGEPSPAEGISKRKEMDRAPEILSPDQAWAGLKVLEEQAPDLVWYFSLGCWAGLRPMELSRLRWEDLLWDQGHVAVRPEVAGKTLRERFVPMEGAVKALETVERPKRKGGGGRSVKVCGYKDPVRISTLLKEAGIVPVWTQDVMRHSYISYRIARGDSLARIAEEAGNSEGVIRRRYRRPVMASEGARFFG